MSCVCVEFRWEENQGYGTPSLAELFSNERHNTLTANIADLIAQGPVVRRPFSLNGG